MKTADVSKNIDPQSSPSSHYSKKLSASDIVTVRQRSNVQQPSWFSALRSRLSQLTMPDWLSQLGIGASQSQNHHPTRHSVTTMPISESISSDISSFTSIECAPNMGSNLPTSSNTLAKICDRHAISLDTPEGTEEDLLNVEWSVDSTVLDDGNEHVDTLKTQHFGPLNNLTLERQDPGRGHKFVEMSLTHPTWCDKCGDFMWGFLTGAVKCEYCNYTCHVRCKVLVTLDCKEYEATLKSSSDDLSPSPSSPCLYPNLQVIVNSEAPDVEPESKMEAEIPLGCSSSEEKYSGFIQIHMNFTRPINVVAGETCPSVFDVVNTTGSTNNTRRTITTFFLPRNTVKTVNISSEMTTREMIITLLRKFKVADNPRKFSLYERICDIDDQNTETKELLRVPDDAHPLRIARSWLLLNQRRQFVLQENDTGDILWEMFEVPELENFLRILAIEEKQYMFRIRQKYNSYMYAPYNIDQQLRIRGIEIGSNEGLNGTSV